MMIFLLNKQAYQTLWENPDSGFSQFWKAVAKEFHGMPTVIGGDLHSNQ